MSNEHGDPGGQAHAAAPLAELEALVGELNQKVTALRETEFDAAGLEARLRELNELAARAAGLLERASR